MSEIIVAPSILSGDFANMGKSVRDIKDFGGDWVHCDVMDGVYVPNFTFGMPMVEAIRKETNLTLDVHLMMIKPEKYVTRFAESGADIITFHPDASMNPEECIDLIRRENKKCGIVFNPDVDIDTYVDLFDKCDIIVVMTVFAGYGGQKLIPECLDRLKYIKKIVIERKLNILLEVDGGVTTENVGEVIECGADVIVAGSAVFRAKDPTEAVRLLRKSTK